jgi:hypothetical protein
MSNKVCRPTEHILAKPPPSTPGIHCKNGLYVRGYLYILTRTHHYYVVANKPRGLQAARKLRNTRRDNRWVCLPFVLLPAVTQIR